MFYFLTSCGSQKELSPLCVQTNQPAGRSMINYNMHDSKNRTTIRTFSSHHVNRAKPRVNRAKPRIHPMCGPYVSTLENNSR